MLPEDVPAPMIGGIRCLYIIDSLFPGGAARSLAAMAHRLVAAGVHLEVAYLIDRPGLRNELQEAGAHVLPIGGVSRLARTRQATRLVRLRRPDLIHTTLFEADICGRIAGQLTGTPVVSSLVNVAYGPEQLSDPRLIPWKVRAAKLLDALTARGVTRFHAVTQQVSDVMSGRLKIPQDRIDVVPRGRDPQDLGTRTRSRTDVIRTNLGLNQDTRLVLAIGRQEHQKGYDVLLEAIRFALRDEPRIQLVVAGREGNATDALREEVKRLQLEHVVRFLGHRGDVPDLLCAADAFVLSSRWEGLPGAVLEAMVLGAPIVATDLPSVREVLDGGRCGLLVPPEQPEELAAAVVATIRERDVSQGRAALAKQRFLQQYTVDRVADKMLAFYGRALFGPGRPQTVDRQKL